jgi:hypothetical protein
MAGFRPARMSSVEKGRRSQNRMLSKNGNRLKRFEELLDTLPAGYVFDGEIVALDDGGRPVFNDLLYE